ncbi:2Fe-2S iron-sulfur cluster binding domain-containing protein [Rhizobacter sp. AJA081-3]|uniref:2Fe-2S iron-sulfur cluster-binding protein n=1 Tax=Rhizobacter sp. AJA081-3 TaxID=2753607 RepID=UPI001ADFEC8E|nr:2Fe-2S iron-sulfur cluster-binding protein [Rhizobacter sp. AJA081-3]QTN25761.1 2Fe-2S iron-sulfur cluster binding domain-containing protein [Rhizobacter sp. AJA081-3]
MEVLVQPLNRVIRVQPGANLLQALQAAQIPMSYSCMAGRCGTCRCRVLDGEVMEGGSDQQRLLEGDDSFVLACQTYVTEPCTIEIPEPDEVVVHPARIVKATVAALEDLTHDIKRLVLRPAKPMEFSPGQYVQLQFTPEHARPYSMAGLSGDGLFEFHVRLVPDGRVTGYIAHELKVGDAVKVSGPLGSAYLRRRHEGPMLCVAGGTGLAPILSILRGAIAQGMANPIHLYFGLRSPRDIYGMPWLEQLERDHPRLNVHVVVTSGGNAATHRMGLVTDAIEQDHGDMSAWRAYLCGSPPMVEAATVVARRKGIAAAHIYADAFYTQGT